MWVLCISRGTDPDIDLKKKKSIVDLLIPGQSPGIKERLVDLYGKPELLFFGPDGALTLLGASCGS